MKLIVSLIKIGILGLLVFFVMYKYNINVDVNVGDQEVKKFVVENGEGVSEIAEKLYEQGLIKSEFYFKLFVKKAKEQANLKAGEYVIDGEVDMKKIVEMLSDGDTVENTKDILIKEGMNTKEIDAYIQEKELMPESCLDKFTTRKKNLDADFSIYSFLNEIPDNNDLEGFFFPDTYTLFENAGCDELMVKMLNNFEQKVDDKMKQDIKDQGRTFYEIITMASLLEKEVRTEKDMKLVSGLFWDRIKNGQPLQSCATLAYVLGVNKPQYTIEDTQIDSPYNTYRNQGLPPSPVSNPGLQAIKAATYPEYTDYNYFLSRPDTGETVFSATYEEHLINKAKYLK